MEQEDAEGNPWRRPYWIETNVARDPWNRTAMALKQSQGSISGVNLVTISKFSEEDTRVYAIVSLGYIEEDTRSFLSWNED